MSNGKRGEQMTFEDYFKKELDMSDCGAEISAELYDILKETFEAGQKNCACLRSDNSAVIDKLRADIEALEMKIGKMKCCENCQTVVDAEGNCYQKKDGLCINYSRWEVKA